MDQNVQKQIFNQNTSLDKLDEKNGIANPLNEWKIKTKDRKTRIELATEKHAGTREKTNEHLIQLFFAIVSFTLMNANIKLLKIAYEAKTITT